MRRLDTPAKIALITFCTRFHFYIHIYALYLQSRGLTLLQISTIESVVIAVQFAADVPTSIFADRIGRRWSVVMSVALMMSAEALFLFSSTYLMYLVVALLTGLGFALSSGAMEALVYDSLPTATRDGQMTRIMGNIGSIGQIAFFISPLIGGVVVGDLSTDRVRVAITLTVLALLVGVLVSLTLEEDRRPAHEQHTSVLTIVREGLAALKNNRNLRGVVLFTVLTAPFTGTLVTTLGPPYLTHFEVSPYAIGVALSLGSLLSAFTQRLAHRVEKSLGVQRGLLILTLLPGVLYIVAAVVTGPLAAWSIVVILYGFNDMRAPLLSGYQNSMIESRSRATVLSLTRTAMSAFLAVAAPLYAGLAERSLPLTFVAMGSLILFAGVVLRPHRSHNG